MEARDSFLLDAAGDLFLLDAAGDCFFFSTATNARWVMYFAMTTATMATRSSWIATKARCGGTGEENRR
jgi:hypothetical protein